MTGDGADNLLVMTVSQPGRRPQTEYRYWHEARWNPVPADAWQQAVIAKLGAGARVSRMLAPAGDSLVAKARVGLPGTPLRKFTIEFGFTGGVPVVERITPDEHKLMMAGGTAASRHAH